MIVGCIDSGVGGFSILNALESAFPHQDFLYLSDQKNFPYSEKSPETLQQIGREAVRILQKNGCEIICIACNTLTVNAIATLRREFSSLRFVGTVPAVKPASEQLPQSAHVVVLATKNTAESEYVQQLVAPFRERTHFSLIGSTQLVQAIEEWDEQKIDTELRELLLPLNAAQPITGVVLGCTHFGFIVPQLHAVLGHTVHIFTPYAGIIAQLERIAPELLQTTQIQAPMQKTQFISTRAPQVISDELREKYYWYKNVLTTST